MFNRFDKIDRGPNFKSKIYQKFWMNLFEKFTNFYYVLYENLREINWKISAKNVIRAIGFIGRLEIYSVLEKNQDKIRKNAISSGNEMSVNLIRFFVS